MDVEKRVRRGRGELGFVGLACGLVIGLGAGLGACAQGPAYAGMPLELDERAVAAEAIPAEALEALRAQAGGASISGFEMEDRGVFRAYEGEWPGAAGEDEATVLGDGSLLETEQELASDALLPAGVAARVESLRAMGYRVSVGRRLVVLYDVDAEREGGEARELLLRPDGSSAIVR